MYLIMSFVSWSAFVIYNTLFYGKGTEDNAYWIYKCQVICFQDPEELDSVDIPDSTSIEKLSEENIQLFAR